MNAKQTTPVTVSPVSGQLEDQKAGQRQPDGLLILFFLAFGLADPLH